MLLFMGTLTHIRLPHQAENILVLSPFDMIC
jgi:hypothetical protein